MISDPVFSVTDEGISAPTYAEILEYLQDQAKSIFGSDINLDEDTQDGQLLAIFAAALHDVNSEAIGVYGAYNPATAIGTALDSAVKVNGLTRREATFSTVDVTLIGQAGTTISGGTVKDTLDQTWNLPDSVTIPKTGEITVTATASEAGAVTAAAGSVTVIGTPTYGWQSVSNSADAIAGVAVETDAELRQEQEMSTALPSVSLWEGILAAVWDLDGVSAVSGIRNESSETSAEGVPSHSIAVVAYGGDANKIGETIFLKKSEGVGTYGTTTVTYTDDFGYENRISFSRPAVIPVGVSVTISPETTYLEENGEQIIERIVAYVNSLGIGEDVVLTRVIANAIKDDSGAIDTTFAITDLKLKKSGGSFGTASIDVAWNEIAQISADDVTLTVA